MKNNRFYIALFLLSGLLMFGCAQVQTTKGTAFPKVYQQKPLTVLALPPINTTSSPVAKEYMVCTIAEPLSFSGYYIYPIEISNDILKKEGLYDTEILSQELLPKFKELFDVDAVLYSRIFKWDTSYYVVGGNVTVGLDYCLVSTATGDTLWKYSGIKKVDTTQDNQGGGMAGLAIALIATAVATATTDYLPIAREINFTIFNTLPKGKYSPRFDIDQNDTIYAQ